ncbi:NDK7-like protein [Mya arenaria]|uniref:Nucleoside diphosphate kinase n=1 Tax=Mya arenaria TaxID=6604 RepID=A0ABY7G5S3_MYAAR|nr:NDK7-like protein [Mya arenaria]
MMREEADERYCFLVEWYDGMASLIRRYHFMFYTRDNSVEMFDIKNNRLFLKRTKCDGVGLGHLYIGATLDLFSRQINFIDYGDDFTKQRLSQQKESTLINFMTSGPVVAFELMGTNAISQWRELIGPTDSAEARKSAPISLRARFGKDNTQNAIHGSDSVQSAAREVEFFFPSTMGPLRQNTAKYTDCTCCVIKPHAVAAGNAGKIISAIMDAGFEVSCMQMFHMEKANTEEFYEVYKGVAQEYNAMVMELTSGPCIALEVRAQNAPIAFREMTGPADPEIARHLRPRTLRALYGIDKVKNAVHCTDLPEDGLLEIEYFFKVLDR